jgi:hypothetical protein
LMSMGRVHGACLTKFVRRALLSPGLSLTNGLNT